MDAMLPEERVELFVQRLPAAFSFAASSHSSIDASAPSLSRT